ncbi:MAG: hypothetical protein M3P95_07000, partial [Actinomycetota bacterium]|nr:hypothetical protein [Actinomycetota bacterium]
APTRPGVELLRGALSPRQVRDRAEARRRALAPTGGDETPGQLGLFAYVEPEGDPASAPPAALTSHAPRPARVVRIGTDGDVVRCRRSGCGALVPLPPPGADGDGTPTCPLCRR